MSESSEKYMTRLQEAIEEDTASLLAVFKPCMEALAALDAAPYFSEEAKYNATKRMKKFIQDVWAGVPNQYKPVVEDLVQQALFPAENPPSPLLSEEPVAETTTPEGNE